MKKRFVVFLLILFIVLMVASPALAEPPNWSEAEEACGGLFEAMDRQVKGSGTNAEQVVVKQMIAHDCW